MKLLFVYIHLRLAISIDFVAIFNASYSYISYNASAAHSANKPPEPIALNLSCISTLPQPSISINSFLSATSTDASNLLK